MELYGVQSALASGDVFQRLVRCFRFCREEKFSGGGDCDESGFVFGCLQPGGETFRIVNG